MTKHETPVWVITSGGRPYAAFEEETLAEEFVEILQNLPGTPADYDVVAVDFWGE